MTLDHKIALSFEPMPTEPHRHTVSHDEMQASGDDACDICGVVRYKHEIVTVSPQGHWRWAAKWELEFPVMGIESDRGAWEAVPASECWIVLKMLEWLGRLDSGIEIAGGVNGWWIGQSIHTEIGSEESVTFGSTYDPKALPEAIQAAYCKSRGIE